MVFLKEGAIAFFGNLVQSGIIYIVSIAIIVLAIVLGGKLRKRKTIKDEKINAENQ